MQTKEYMEILFAVITGIGLSAACGFRIFVPFLALNLASMYGLVSLSPGFEWISGYYATIAFASAMVLEIAAYYVPWLDNVMDAITSPVSIIAGTIATASMITDIPHSLKWMVSIIAGGGIAGLLQGATTALRAKSSLFTAGIGNSIIATLEFAGSVIISLLAIIIPIIGFIVVAAIAIYLLIIAAHNFIRKMRADT
jgi:hypothetical protein